MKKEPPNSAYSCSTLRNWLPARRNSNLPANTKTGAAQMALIRNVSSKVGRTDTKTIFRKWKRERERFGPILKWTAKSAQTHQQWKRRQQQQCCNLKHQTEFTAGQQHRRIPGNQMLVESPSKAEQSFPFEVLNINWQLKSEHFWKINKINTFSSFQSQRKSAEANIKFVQV